MRDAPDPPARFSLQVLPAGFCVPAPADRTLLQALLDAGARLPSSCRNGTCRTCMCRLLDGRIHYRIAWPGLLAEEKAEGWVLPCAAYPLCDVVIAATQATAPD